MGPLNDENKIQVDEKNNKNWKVWKILKMYNIKNFKTIGYKLTALGNITPLIVNYKFMRPIRILRLPKNKQKRQKQQHQKN